MTIAKAARRVFQKVAKVPASQSGFLGRADGAVRVPGRRKWLYARLYNGNVVEAYNSGNVPVAPGLAVDIIYLDGRYTVQARQVYQDVVDTSIPDGLEDELRWPGTHTLYVRPEQFLAGLVYPKSGMTVYVIGGNVPLPGDGYVQVPPQEIDLSAYLPVSGAHWAVVSLLQDGTVSVTTGGAAVNWSMLDRANIPNAAGYPVAAIRLHVGQSSIQHGRFGSMVEDLRWFRAGGGSLTLPPDKVIATKNDAAISANAPTWDDANRMIGIGDAPLSGLSLANNTGLYAGASDGKVAGGIFSTISNVTSSIFQFIRARGTSGAMEGVTDNTSLGSFAFGGLISVAEGIQLGAARLIARASENWSATGRGARLQLVATPNGSTAPEVVVDVYGDKVEFLKTARGITPDAGSNDTTLPTTAWVRTFGQPLASDLTAIAALSPPNNDIIQRKAGVWTNRTMAQLAADLTGLLPSSGWLAGLAGWTYSSADNPSFVVSIPNADAEKIGVGWRIALTQSTVKYFIVTAKGTPIGGNTPLTVYGGTDYTLTNAAIASPLYSPVKAPFGFPLSPTKWLVETTNNVEYQQASPVAGTWYNPGNISLTIPIGAWRITKAVCVRLHITSAAVGQYSVRSTLSASNNGETDNDYHDVGLVPQPAGTNLNTYLTQWKQKNEILAAKSTRYLNVMTGSSGANFIATAGNVAKTILRAECAYL